MLRLTTFTFLNGPKESGKSTLAQALASQDTNLAVLSFAEPIRNALLSTFHGEQLHAGLDLRDADVKRRLIPGTGVTYRQWMISFSDFMKSLHGPQIFGDLAKRSVEDISHYYHRFVFDDCRFAHEVYPFINAYGTEHITLIHIERLGSSWTGDVGRPLLDIPAVRHVGFINNFSSPEDALKGLQRILEPKGGGLHDAQTLKSVPNAKPITETIPEETVDLQSPPPSVALEDI